MNGFADYKINVPLLIIYFLKMEMKKSRMEYFLLFPQCFQMPYFPLLLNFFCIGSNVIGQITREIQSCLSQSKCILVTRNDETVPIPSVRSEVTLNFEVHDHDARFVQPDLNQQYTQMNLYQKIQHVIDPK